MANLDRKRPFTHAWGIVADDEPFFFQDGKEFYGDGTPVVVEEEEVPVQASPQVSVAVKPTSLADIAEGKANKKPKTEVKKPKVETKTAVAEPEEKLSAEVTHDFL